MIVTDRAVFLQLPKAASTSLQRLVRAHYANEHFGKHARLEAAPAARIAGLPVVATVRDPFAWYVSLFRFGCSGQGLNYVCATSPVEAGRLPVQVVKRLAAAGVHATPDEAALHLAAEARRDPAFWQDLYRDADDVPAFRRWLLAVLDPTHAFVSFPDHGYNVHVDTLGLFSHVLLQLFSLDVAPLFGAGDAPGDPRDHFAPDRLSPSILGRAEHFEADLRVALDRVGHEIDDVLDAALTEGLRVNRSGEEAELARYYDPTSWDLVAERDALAIEWLQSPPEALLGPLPRFPRPAT